jgi:uncharacterized membrane protein
MRVAFKRFTPFVLIAAYPVLAHASHLLAWPYLQTVAAILLLLGIFWQALLNKRLLPWALFVSLSAFIVLLEYLDLMQYLLYLLPVIIPGLLLIFFGKTLLPGQEPLITAIGEAARGPLTMAMRKYTRLLTQLWCLVFFIMMVWSSVLPWIQQPLLWSWFTNVINYGIVGILFVGEFMLRKKLFPEHNHPSFIEYIEIIIQSNFRH